MAFQALSDAKPKTTVPKRLGPGGRDATIVRDADGRLAYRFVYRAHSAGAFDRYTAEFAPALQADHTSRFEGSFVAHRELLPIVDRF